MAVLTTIGFLLSVIWLVNGMAVRQPMMLHLSGVKLTSNHNEYFDDWSIDRIPMKGGVEVTVKILAKKELPSTLQLKTALVLNDLDPIEHMIPICEASGDSPINSTSVESDAPEGSVQKACTSVPGDWTVLKWTPPSFKIPAGIPDGPVSNKIMIANEGQPPYVELLYEGRLTHEVPQQ